MAHRDIKPRNVFMNGQNCYKLGDFGCFFQRKIDSQTLSFAGTFVYQSPQQIRAQSGKGTYSAFKADVYALAITALAYASLEIPGTKKVSAIEKANLLSYSQTFKDLVVSMLSHKEKDRPTMQEILQRAHQAVVEGIGVPRDIMLCRAVRKCLGLVATINADNMCEVAETEKAGKPVLVRVYRRRTLQEVYQLVKGIIHSDKRNSLRSVLLQSLTVKREREYLVEWVLDKRVDFQQTDVRLGLFSEFEDYEKGRILYEKRDKIPQIAIFEGHFQLLRKPVSVKQYVCASLSNLNTCIKEAQMQIKVESLYIHKLLDITSEKAVIPSERS